MAHFQITDLLPNPLFYNQNQTNEGPGIYVRNYQKYHSRDSHRLGWLAPLTDCPYQLPDIVGHQGKQGLNLYAICTS